MEEQVEILRNVEEPDLNERFEYADEGEFDEQDYSNAQPLNDLKDIDKSQVQDIDFKNQGFRNTAMSGNKVSISTPDTKFAKTEFPSGRGNRGNSVQIEYKRKRMSERQDNDGNETFVTSTDVHQQMIAMDDRITKLENLVWTLYRELNTKIDTSVANCRNEVTEVAQNVTQQIGTEIQDMKTTLSEMQKGPQIENKKRTEDEGYEGSDEQFDDMPLPNQPYDPDFPHGELDEVIEEKTSQYDSNIDKSNDAYYDYQGRDSKEIFVRETSGQGTDKPNQFKSHSYGRGFYTDKLSNSEPEITETPEGEYEAEGDEEGNELEYYFSCHERMIKDYNLTSESDVFADINKDELKVNYTAPDLSRSTLVDQIDYSLDNFKLNESSMLNSSIEDAYHTNRNLNSSSLKANKEICADVTPKLMGFLNQEKVLKIDSLKKPLEICSRVNIDNKQRDYKYEQPFIISSNERRSFENQLEKPESSGTPSDITPKSKLASNLNGHAGLRANFTRPGVRHDYLQRYRAYNQGFKENAEKSLITVDKNEAEGGFEEKSDVSCAFSGSDTHFY